MQLETLQALADPSRFRIVEALARGEQAAHHDARRRAWANAAVDGHA